MAGRVAVAAVLLLRLGDAHGTRDCEQLHEVVVVGEGGKETICEETRAGFKYSESTTLYVKPGDDFKGVSLEVTQELFSATSQVAWFGLDECYSDNKWIELKVDVEATNRRNQILQFTLNIGGYRERCMRQTTWNKVITGLSIVAHGSANWTSTAEETGGGCDGPEFTTLQNPPTCTDPPRSITTTNTTTPPPGTTTTTTTTTTAPPVMIAVPIAVVVAVILAIVVCVTYRRRRRGQGEGQVPRVGDEVDVDDNYMDVAAPTGPTVLPRVAPRLGPSASWAVGGEVQVDNNHKKPPTGPTVLPRVAPRLGPGASWPVGGEVQVDNNHKKPPTGPTVLPRVAPRLGPGASWPVGGEVQVDNNHKKPPTGPTVLPRVAPRQQEPEYLYFGDDEEHIYDDIPEFKKPPLHDSVAEQLQCQVDEDSDSDDGNYLTPRPAPPGTPSRVM
ncbi:uncharacterized protein LOC127001116 isoform X7 [Eriocheir sinensis]|uniref:uncharacterized protein LOC127001116 isoform X3 n=1 Tax=Eriocheir sinensis TaxID=95602 RepID=UPI0021CA9D41|nr:uncharacterized protein LOC127001116 isoform X3 [Eriocheir sinensis]XP_050721247.1 uncharacterized protein LOC127001116 isoform X5 [Eriocheir sinensis]XP_050721249.1 uncharacterized protein LOC127001116 isoform X7 [Eriocheir sinensis]